MDDCVFCKIVSREIDSAKVFENENVLVFLDANPVTKGHSLVIPKQHFENIFDIEENMLQKIMVVAKHISVKIKNSLSADGIRISQSNGTAAGQAIFHFHLHIIPRYKNDGISMNETTNAHPPKADVEKLKSIAEEIKSKI